MNRFKVCPKHEVLYLHVYKDGKHITDIIYGDNIPLWYVKIGIKIRNDLPELFRMWIK